MPESTHSFVSLALSSKEGLALHGTFTNREDARLCECWHGINDPHVLKTRTVRLFPVDADPVLACTATGGEVFVLPDDIASGLHHTKKATAQDEPTAALVVLPTRPRSGFIVGPFDTASARDWLARAEAKSGDVPAECHLLAVHPSTRATRGSAAPSNQEGLSVILVDTAESSVCCGPFDSTLAAELLCTGFTSSTRIADLIDLHICELAAPAIPPASTSAPFGDGHVRGWIVRRSPVDGDEKPRLVGLFPDCDSAHHWISTSSPTAQTDTVMPVFQP